MQRLALESRRGRVRFGAARLVLVQVLSLCAVFATTSVAGAQSVTGDHAQNTTSSDSERALLTRLYAPCCWTQTLDVHESPIASELRNEIHTRLAAGESALAIEDDLATRHGERIRAVPRGQEPRQAIPLAVLGGMALAALALIRMVSARPAKSISAQPSQAVPAHLDSEMDARIDSELAVLDDA